MVSIRTGWEFHRGRKGCAERKTGGYADVLLGNVGITWDSIGRDIVNAIIWINGGLDTVAVSGSRVDLVRFCHGVVADKGHKIRGIEPIPFLPIVVIVR